MQTATPARDEACAFGGKIETWVEDECTACVFKDLRLKQRFVALLSRIARTISGSIPFVCQDWANTKAAYRFLSNDRWLENVRQSTDLLADPERCVHIGDRESDIDPPPGNMVIWRGLSRLADIQLGAAIAAQNCG